MEYEIVRKEITGGSEVAITDNRVLGVLSHFLIINRYQGEGSAIMKSLQFQHGI
jgi:hypothetical protein